MYRSTTRSSVSGAEGCCAETEVTKITSAEHKSSDCLITGLSLHFEIAQRHMLVELCVFDMKLDIVVTRPRDREFGNVYPGDLSNFAYGLRHSFCGPLRTNSQRDFRLLHRRAVGQLR